MNKSLATPSWAKAIVAIGGLVVAGGTIYYIVTNTIGAGVNAYKEMYEKQYNELVVKMAGYVNQNGTNGFTASQQQAISEEEKILSLTEQGLANASNGITNTIITIAEIVVGGAVAVGISAAVVRGWLSRSGNKIATGQGAGYIAARSMADQLAYNGRRIQATNVISSMNTMYQVLDLPVMQQSVSSLQASLPALTGIQLLTAQQLITQFQFEMSVIPTLLAAPLPPI
jgi:hypothetical protein